MDTFYFRYHFLFLIPSTSTTTTTTPTTSGVCGTDPRFMLYSTGVFDLDACCTDQNHAITLVGYGYDAATGLDYWLAQNR